MLVGGLSFVLRVSGWVAIVVVVVVVIVVGWRIAVEMCFEKFLGMISVHEARSRNVLIRMCVGLL